MFSEFFINRPRFAAVISIIIVIIGLIAIKILPIQEYPRVTPPQIMVQAVYPGADADTVAKTVAAPLEDAINGVENMIYIVSTASSTGMLSMNVVFDVGTDPARANVDVNNRVQVALNKLPEDVKRQGVNIRERSPDLLQVISFTSENNIHDSLWINNFVANNVIDELKRIKGVGDAMIFGNKEYSMRVWLEPDKLAKYGLTASDVINAVRSQNIQISAGTLGDEPINRNQGFTYALTTQGRLKTPEEFQNIIIKSNLDGSSLRLGDLSRIELGAERYMLKGRFNGQEMAPVGIFLSPGANALETATEVGKTLKRISEKFPKDVKYKISYDTTKFINISIKEVIKTLFEALFYVTLILFLFLGNIRATLIPSLAIPVSIIGTFAGMYLLGFSINLLTLFGLILSIGLVVDDAIIVIENTERILKLEPDISVKNATIKSMKEIQNPVIANVLVLFAVFIPVAFIGGFSGVMYKQFAVTIVISMFISGVVALTLTPALCVVLLKGGESKPIYPIRKFHELFDWLTEKFSKSVQLTIRYGFFNILIFAGLLILTMDIIKKIPTNLVPEEDKGALMIVSYLMPGSSLQRSDEVMLDVTDKVLKEGNFDSITTLAGLDLSVFAFKSDSGVSFAMLKDWSERRGRDQSSFAIVQKLMGVFSQNKEALIFPLNPPPIMGMSNTGGFEIYIQDRTAADPQVLGKYVQEIVQKGNQRAELMLVRTNFNPNVPQIMVNVDREKAKSLGVEVSDIYATLGATLGTYYINDFNMYGKTYHVNLQVDGEFRENFEDFKHIFVKSSSGSMIPVSTLVNIEKKVGPSVIQRFNMFNAAQITGQPKPGYSSGDAIKAIEDVAKEVLPNGYTIAYSGTTYQEKKLSDKGNNAVWYALLFIFLILVALYESWTLPIVILMTVPIAVLGASGSVFFRGLANNVYFQVGLITLIGLTAKNAILIVEFAQQKLKEGGDLLQAAIDGAKVRFRPIMMTSLTFILGALPLAISSGAGANSRIIIGTTVVGGMILVTFIGIFYVPLFYYILMKLRHLFRKFAGKSAVAMIFLIFLITGCSFTPELKLKEPPIPEKIDSTTDMADDIKIDIDWWKKFNDENLNRVVREVLENNKDIKLATMRVSLALANLGIEDSYLYPSISGNAGAARNSVSKEVSPYKGSILNNYNIGGVVSYEIDFWGKIKAQKASAVNLYNSSIYDKKVAMISAVSTAVNLYLSILATRNQMEITEKFIHTYEDTYKFRKVQYEHGLISDYLLENTKVALLNAQSQLTNLKDNLVKLNSNLSIIMGRDPKDLFEKGILVNGRLPENLLIPPISSQILLQRPDIMSALERVKASNFLIGAAKSLYYPSISLTGSIGFASNELDNLMRFSANFWNIGSILYVPIFDFGKIKNTVKKSEINLDIAINDYEKIVQNAFKEVYDILNRIKSLKEKKSYKIDEISSIEKLVNRSKREYEVGRISIFEVHEYERNLLNKRLELVAIDLDILSSYVQFYKAIGAGGFEE